MRTCNRCGTTDRYGSGKCKVCDRRGARLRRDADPRRVLLERAKQRAKLTGVPCTLTLDDIEVPDACPVLGISLRPARGGSPKDGSPTLDKLIPEWGYTRNNVVVISHLANRIKSSGTAEQVRKVADWMLTQGLS